MKKKIRSARLRMCLRRALASACCLVAFALCSSMPSARAVGPSGEMALIAARMQCAGGQVHVSFAIKITPHAVYTCHRWVTTPCLGNTSDSVSLSLFMMTGRTMACRARQQRLLKGSADGVGHRLTAHNEDTFLYIDTLRCIPWMESGLNLRLDIDRGSCCRVQTMGNVVSSGAFPVASPYHPSICRVTPRVSRSAVEHTADYPFLCETSSRPLCESDIGIHFRVASTAMDTLYSANTGNLYRIAEVIGLLRTDSCASLRSISIIGYVSPEGATELNWKLSARHAEALRHAPSDRMNLPVPLFELNAGGVNWGRLVEPVNESDMTYREEVSVTLRSHPGEEQNDRLKTLAGGCPYRSVLDMFYPQLYDACYIHVEYTNRPGSVADMANRAIVAIRVRNYEEVFRLLKAVEVDERSWSARGVCRPLCGDDREAGIWLYGAAKAGNREAEEDLKKMNAGQRAATTGIAR